MKLNFMTIRLGLERLNDIVVVPGGSRSVGSGSTTLPSGSGAPIQSSVMEGRVFTKTRDVCEASNLVVEVVRESIEVEMLSMIAVPPMIPTLFSIVGPATYGKAN